MKNEDELEKAFKHESNCGCLMKAIGWDGSLQRQWPVGVFADSVGEGNHVFTGRKSAIDLALFDPAKGAAVFELKKPGNKQVGAISELMFYCNIVRDVQRDL